jgi:hypothetical protein
MLTCRIRPFLLAFLISGVFPLHELGEPLLGRWGGPGMRFVQIVREEARSNTE